MLARRRTKEKSGCHCWTNAKKRAEAENLLRLNRFGFSLNFFGEGRLTQSTNLKADGSSSDGKTPANQAQAGFFQTGLYLPMRKTGMDWRHHGNLYSFFGAPLVKYGAVWLNDGVVIGQKTVKEPDDTGTVTGKTFAGGSTTTPIVAKGAQYFYGMGARFGFMKYTLLGHKALNRQIRHDPIGYIDVTYGQNYALRTPGLGTVVMEPLTGTPVAAAYRSITTTGSTVDPRISIESRVKLPNLPAFVGMDVNLNRRHPGQSVTEFRFVAGFRVDAAQALGRAFGIGSK